MEKKKYYLPHKDGEPVLRVGVFQGQDNVDFLIKDPFDITDLDGNVLASGIHNNRRWRVKIKDQIAGKEMYELILFETYDEQIAMKRLAEARGIDPAVDVALVGGDVYLGDTKIHENVKYRLIFGNYPDEHLARKDSIRFRPIFAPMASKKIMKESVGKVEIFDSEYEFSFELDKGVRVVPHNPSTLLHFLDIVRYDKYYQKEYKKDLYYNGTIEVRFDANGDLMVINELPIEVYLRRAIFSESETGLPKDFYKALAIVIRSEILARVGHQHITEPFDLCDWGHCLRFYGEKFDDPNINEAIEETRGMVLQLSDGEILDAFFNLICGGHTEEAVAVWDIDVRTKFKARYDSARVPEGFHDLTREEEVKRWINQRPESFCNLQHRNVPRSLMVNNRYFRWEVFYTRKELEELIQEKVGVELGELIDIIPVKRGKSGRLKEIQLVGSLKTVTLSGELNIRSALSYDYLDSSCFIVEKEFDETGFPIAFTLLGAGQGHGVGMCKTGATVMALEGYTYEKILEHYFETANIKKLYE